MKLTLKTKAKSEKQYKCYRCGCISFKVIKYCPLCTKEGFQIRMILIMESENK